MSGLEHLKAVTKQCCALRLFVWRAKAGFADITDGTTFTCATPADGACGQIYRFDRAIGWTPISALEDIGSVLGHHEY